MCIFMYACLYICVHVHLDACTFVGMPVEATPQALLFFLTYHYIILLLLVYLFVCICVCVRARMRVHSSVHVIAHLWRSESNLWASLLSLDEHQ